MSRSHGYLEQIKKNVKIAGVSMILPAFLNLFLSKTRDRQGTLEAVTLRLHVRRLALRPLAYSHGHLTHVQSHSLHVADSEV